MNVQKRNDVSIYCLSSGTTIPEWLSDRARRNMSKRDESVRRRIELLQEFQMPASSSKLRASGDGRYIFAAGTYPPRIRCFDVNELGLKFERYVTAQCIDMSILGQDYGKLALLLDDRTVEFHAHYGSHEKVRIPSFGRALEYESTTCELLIAAPESIFRINLEEGRFREPWTMQLSPNDDHDSSPISASCLARHPHHALAAAGCDDGTVRFWDSRTSDTRLRPFLQLDVTTPLQGLGYADEFSGHSPMELTSIAHDPLGLYTAVGTGGGLVALYDMRSSRPLYIQQHKLGKPIHTVRFHAGSGLVLSGDEQLIKVWHYKAKDGDSKSLSNATGSTMTEEYANLDQRTNGSNINNNHDNGALGSVKVNIQGNGKLTHFIVAGDESDPEGNRSGVILCATDKPIMDTFFVPALGPAPHWCSYLENITEELEEHDLQRTDGAATAGEETVFENYKFVTRDDLVALGMSHLVGTPMLRAYMHGFFMDVQLYHRIKAVANPFEYEEYQKQKVRQRLQEKQSSRIAPKLNIKKKPPVNADLADRLQQKADSGKTSTTAKAAAQGLLADTRFGSLFSNPDFAIDQEDEDFKLRNPSGVAAIKRRQNNLDSDDEGDDGDDYIQEKDIEDDLVGNEVMGSQSDEGYSDDSCSDGDGFDGGKVRGEAYESMKKLQNGSALRSLPQPPETRSGKRTKKKVAILEEDDDDAIIVGLQQDLIAEHRCLEQLHMTLAERKALESQRQAEQPQVRFQQGADGSGYSKEATYIPRDTKRKINETKIHGTERGNRRGIKELGFKTPFRNKK